MSDSDLRLLEPRGLMHCFKCQSTSGRLLDWGIDVFGEPLYSCKLCIRTASQEYGLLEGEELDRLMKLGEDGEALADEAEGYKQQVAELKMLAGHQGDKIASLEDRLQHSVETNEQLHGIVRSIRTTIDGNLTTVDV